MLRLFILLAAALGLFFSPVSMARAGGMAMPHDGSVEVSETDGHCAAGSESSSDSKSQAEISCGSACAALSPMSVSPASLLAAARLREPQLPAQLLAGVPPDGETPPPRMTSEI